jgi:glycosyltransferase involved in cell wall biosynthesis
MHILVLFHNVGGYHAARLRAAQRVCDAQGWSLTALQVRGQTQEHPWGELTNLPFSLHTILSGEEFSDVLYGDDEKGVDRLAAQQIPHWLESLQPDVVLIPGWGFAVSRVMLRWCRQHHIPTVLMSESKRDDEPRRWWKEQVKSWLWVRHYDAALVGGDRHHQYLQELGMPENRIFLGYDVVDNAYFREQAAITRQDPQAARERQPQIPHRPYLLAVTRLIPRKNVIRLVDAYRIYRQEVGEDSAWDLVVCGSGMESAAIQQRLQQYALLDAVHLPGFLTYAQMGDWYGLAQGFVHPALREQWGLVVNEACAAGLPILSSQTVGACDLLVRSGKNGLTFDPTDPEAIAQALVTLHRLPPDQRAAWGYQSQALVDQYGPDQFGEGFQQAIQRAIAHRAVA